MAAHDEQDADIRISPAQFAYLAAFDVWLKHVWAKTDTPRNDIERGIKRTKDAALLAVRLEPRGETYSAGLAICAGCGSRFARRRGPGRPRKRCEDCSPRRQARV